MVERKNEINNESGESIEEWFSNKKERLSRQKEFRALPTFIEKDDKPAIRETEKVIRKEQKSAIATNLSSMEVLIPWLYEKAGFIEGDLVGVDRSPHVEKLSIVGQELHEAESLFSVVLQKDNGLYAHEVLPTSNDELVLRIEKASDGLIVRQDDDKETIRENLESAWQRFCDLSLEKSPENHTLPGFGIMGPLEREKLEYNDEIRDLGDRLAVRWAEEINKERPMSLEKML